MNANAEQILIQSKLDLIKANYYNDFEMLRHGNATFGYNLEKLESNPFDEGTKFNVEEMIKLLGIKFYEIQ